MRRARVDDNQPEIVKALRSVGATVEHLHRVGGGCPDLLVGWRGVNTLIEVKDGNKCPSERALSPGQQDWHDAWKGQVAKVETVDEALQAIGAKARDSGWRSIGDIARDMTRGTVE